MKPPFPAFQVRPSKSGVSIIPVRVLELFPVTHTAYVAYGPGMTGRAQVNYAELASTIPTAVKLVAEALAEFLPLPASSEKSAVTPLAGGEAG